MSHLAKKAFRERQGTNRMEVWHMKRQGLPAKQGGFRKKSTAAMPIATFTMNEEETSQANKTQEKGPSISKQ